MAGKAGVRDGRRRPSLHGPVRAQLHERSSPVGCCSALLKRQRSFVSGLFFACSRKEIILALDDRT